MRPDLPQALECGGLPPLLDGPRVRSTNSPPEDNPKAALRKASGQALSRRTPKARATFLAALAGIASASAQLPSPRLDTAFPPGGRAGTGVEITLTSADLPEATALVFDTPGFIATKLEALKFRVAIAADCARGLHELRASGRYGISTPLPFVVGDAPELLDPGANHTRETAAAISLPGVVEGRADAELRDFYKFTAAKGQALHVACSAFALDSPMDPVVAILDAKGATLARADNELDRDAQLVFTAPADGEYIIVVQDKLFAGSPAHHYRLAVGTEPEMPLRPPAIIAVNPNPLSETEPNDTAASAQPLELPAEVCGAFDGDWFAFRAEAGKPLWLEVVADRDGHASDAALVVFKVTRDAAGAEQSKQMLELDDQPDLPAPPRWQLGSRDPAGRFVPDETATYRVRLSDRFARRGGYRLIVREATPDFAVVALGESLANEDKKVFKWQPNLRRGGSAGFAIAALRRGYEGEIVLRVEGLPPGTTASGFIAAGAPTGTLVFHAPADAPPWAGHVRLVAESGGVSREVRTVNYRWNVTNRDEQRLATRLGSFAIGIADELAPLAITLAGAQSIAAQIGTDLEIGLKIARSNPDAQPKGEWQLSALGLSGLNKFEPVKFDGAAATETKILLRLQNKDGNAFKAGTHTVFFRARGTVGYKADAKGKVSDLKHMEFSVPLTLTLTEPAAPPVAAAK